jgi:hypothetical protein
MNIRWRLSIVAIQLGILIAATFWATGKLYSAESWFAAGLLSVVISSQILEPFYSRPADVIGNVVICIFLYLTTSKQYAEPAWTAFLVFILSALILALLALWLGAGKQQGKLASIGRFAKTISSEATAVRIYSVVFWLSLIEYHHDLGESFWRIGFAWALIVIIGLVDWAKAWGILTGNRHECSIEGMIGPSRIALTASALPLPGNWIILRGNNLDAKGVVVSRIQRIDDAWGQVFIEDQGTCETLLKARNLSIEFTDNHDNNILGISDVGSTQDNLVFFPNRPLEIGNVVAIHVGNTEVLYQIDSAKIQQLDIKGGGNLQVQAQAKQIGYFDPETYRLKQYYWVPNPGTTVTTSNLKPEIDETKITSSSMLIGSILGTEIPVYLDTKLAGEGHLVILGMTKMGKTTLALRLINSLAKERIVTVLDQTGEYQKKRGLPKYTADYDNSQPGIAVFEPLATEIAADRALNYLNYVLNFARKEYETDTIKPRVLLIEEAHQFIPEPSGLGFNAPGRDSAFKFGSLMMQIRKYGICVVLISQRTAVVAKSALSQCENIIAFKSVDKTGLDYLDTVAGQDLSNMLPLLKQGEAVVFGPAFSCDVPVAIKILKEEAKDVQPTESSQEIEEIHSQENPDDIPITV